MCIIVYIPKGIQADKYTLSTCFANNPDGSGIMYQDDNKVRIIKGLMSFAAFWQEYEKISSDVDRVLHFRIATSGGINGKNCHPFPLCDDLYEMQKVKNVCNTGIAHNGIISMSTPAAGIKDKFSDTMYFIRDYLYKLGSDIEREEIKALVRQATSSRFAIMTPEKVTLIGDYNTEDGIFYSNYSYYNYKSYVGTSTSTTGKKKKGKHTTAISPAYGVYVNDNYNADIDDLNGVDIDDDYYIIDICLRATDSGKKLKKAIEETWDELEKLSCYPLAYIDKQADSDGIVTFEVRRLPKMVLDGDMDKIAGRWWYSLGKNSEV